MSEGFIKIHGKNYETVAHRLERFRKDHPNGWIECKILTDDGKVIVMRAAIGFETGTLIATGHAEEIRGSSNINKTSALENCETSAIGRGLAAAGYESGGSIASADEVEVAVARQESALPASRLSQHLPASRLSYEKTVKKTAKKPKKEKEPRVTANQLEALSILIEAHDNSEGYLNEILSWGRCDHIKELTQEQAGSLLSASKVKA